MTGDGPLSIAADPTAAKFGSSVSFQLSFGTCWIVEQHRQFDAAVARLWEVCCGADSRVERRSSIVRREQDQRVTKFFSILAFGNDRDILHRSAGRIRIKSAGRAGQNENMTRRSMRRFADCVLNTPPARAVDWPNNAELRLPIGGAGFTWLKILRALALKVRL
jgi:hypothetical protein